MAISLVLICGCETQKSDDPKKLSNSIPPNAKNVIDKGNGWTTFDLDGNRFLYHRSIHGNAGWECVTVIPSKDE